MKYNEDYINQKRKMVKRYLDAGHAWIIQHIKDCYDEEASNLILEAKKHIGKNI